MTPKIYNLPSQAALPPERWWHGRLWAALCLLIGGAGLLVLYGAVLITPVREALHGAEQWVYRFMNASMGKNAAWDWTVLVAGSGMWVMISLAFVLTGALWEGWRIRLRDYGRVFGYLIFVALAAVLTLEAADYIADEVERQLPWRKEAILAMVQQYDAEFLDYEAKSGILNDIVAVWIVILLMIAPRLPRTALAGTALLAAHGLSSMIIGSEWLLGQGAAVLFGSLAGGAAMLAGRRPLQWVERKSSTLFLSWFWRSVYHDALNRPAFAGRDTILSMLKTLKRKRLPLRELKWRRLAQQDVLSLLGHTTDEFEISETPPGPPQSGFRPSRRVRFLTVNAANHYVIRAIWRWGAWIIPSEKFKRYAESARCNLYLEKLGLPVARIYWVSERVSLSGFRKIGYCVEQFLPARPMNVDDLNHLRQAAQLMAQMHSHESPNWGAVANFESRAPSQYILHFLRQDILYFLRKSSRWLRLNFNPADMERIWKLFEAEALAVLSHDPPPFRLIHSDVHFRNILIDDDGEPWIVDFGQVSYDLAGWEIVKMAVALGMRRPDQCRLVWREYFEQAGEDRWIEFKRQARLGLARFALREVAQKRALAGRPRKERSKEDVAKWIEELFIRSDDWWGERPDDTQFSELIAFLSFKPAKQSDGVVAAGQVD